MSWQYPTQMIQGMLHKACCEHAGTCMFRSPCRPCCSSTTHLSHPHHSSARNPPGTGASAGKREQSIPPWDWEWLQPANDALCSDIFRYDIAHDSSAWGNREMIRSEGALWNQSKSTKWRCDQRLKLLQNLPHCHRLQFGSVWVSQHISRICVLYFHHVHRLFTLFLWQFLGIPWPPHWPMSVLESLPKAKTPGASRAGRAGRAPSAALQLGEGQGWQQLQDLTQT